MSKHFRDVEWEFVALLVFILLMAVLFRNEPDLVDALIARVMSC